MATPAELAIIEDYKKMALATGYTYEMIAVIHQNVAKGTTVSELAYFLNVCLGVGLNPFNKEIWCYKNKQGGLLVFTGRDGFLAKAQKHPRYNGIRSSDVCENDEFSIDIANKTIKHSFGVAKRGKIVGAYAMVFLKDGEPTIEWAPSYRYDKGQFTWSDYPDEMIKKVAECHALKKAFGFTGIQADVDWDIKEGIAVPAREIENEVKEKPDKEKDRLLTLIANCKTKTDLDKLKKNCISADEISAFDDKWKELP